MVANIDDYVPSTVEGLADKLADAQSMLDECDDAGRDRCGRLKSLREARLNARTKADTSALEELIAYAKSLELSGIHERKRAGCHPGPGPRQRALLADPEESRRKR